MSHLWMRRVAWLTGWEPSFKHGSTAGRGMWTFGALPYTLKHMFSQVNADCWTGLFRHLQERCRAMTSPRCKDEHQNLESNWHRGQIIKDYSIDRLRCNWFSSPIPNLDERSLPEAYWQWARANSQPLSDPHNTRDVMWQETNILKHFEQSKMPEVVVIGHIFHSSAL